MLRLAKRAQKLVMTADRDQTEPSDHVIQITVQSSANSGVPVRVR